MLNQDQRERIELLAKFHAKDQRIFTEFQLHHLAVKIFTGMYVSDVKCILKHLGSMYQTITFGDEKDYIEFIYKQLKINEITFDNCIEELLAKQLITPIDVEIARTLHKYQFYYTNENLVRSVGENYDKLVTEPTIKLDRFLIMEDEGGIYFQELETVYAEKTQTFESFLESVYAKIEN